MINEKVIKLLKKGIWLYFYLLVFEGALRKWVLPGLSTPLLIVRDPVAFWLIYYSLKNGVWKLNNYVVSIWLVSFFAFIMAVLVGHGNFTVALYGLRITVLHFPLIFIIGKILDKEDVVKIGKVMLWINIFMTVLVALQFFSPQSAWVNRGIGGDTEGSGFTGNGEFYRVPGLFSFTNGLSFFYGLATAYIFYFWIEPGKVSKIILISSTVALICALPLSISRTMLFEIVLSGVFSLAVSGKSLKNVLLGGVVISMLMVVLSSFSFFNTATSAFTDRFESSNKTEGGFEGVFIDRFLGGMYGAFTDTNATFFGIGLGAGTNAGAKIMTGNTRFLVSEGEWGRLIGEMGFLLGVIVILTRFSVVIKFFKMSWKSISDGNILPWMLLSFAFLNILQGQWAQPTSLGFGILAAGLVCGAAYPRRKIV